MLRNPIHPRLDGATPAFRLMIATSWLAPQQWRLHQEQAIRSAIAAGPDWAEYLRLIHRHQTTVLSWAALSRVPGIEIPDRVEQNLRKLSDAYRVRAMQHALLLADGLKALNRARIPAMPLKGPVLSFELYGDLGLRQSTDLDLQVPQDELHRAIECLESMGWRRGSDFGAMSPRQWQSFLRNGYEMQFSHSRPGFSLELHWRNHWETPEGTKARWARSTPLLWQGYSIHVMSPGDLALFLCVHGAYHIWCCAKWLSDVARAHSIARVDWSAALDIAREAGTEGACPAALSLLHEFYGLEIPIPPGAATEPAGASPSPLLRSPLLPSPLLIDMPIESLQNLHDPRGRTGLALLRNHSRMVRYERLVRPRKTWRESLSELFYCQQDFRMLPLPDSFFWTYKLLRPILWSWRCILQLRHQS